jgi:hypothetical protein
MITPSEAEDCMWQLESKTRQEKESQASVMALMGAFRRLGIPKDISAETAKQALTQRRNFLNL